MDNTDVDFGLTMFVIFVVILISFQIDIRKIKEEGLPIVAKWEVRENVGGVELNIQRNLSVKERKVFQDLINKLKENQRKTS